MLKYTILFLIITANAVQAQNLNSGSFSGIVIYKANVSMRYSGNDTLRFNRHESFFQWERKTLKSTVTVTNNNVPSKRTVKNPPPDAIGSYVIYKAAKDSMYMRKRTRRMADAGNYGIFLKARRPDIHWDISDSTKKVGDFVCTKATAHFHGRNYIAWFTPEISVPYGPWKLVGLPGLILQARDNSNNIRYKAIKVAFRQIDPIGAPPLTGKETILNFPQYKKWMAHREKRLKRKMKEKILKREQEMSRRTGHSISSLRISISIPKPMELFDKD